MLQYKIDILEALKEKGYTQYRIRQEKIFGQGTITSLKKGEKISWETIDKICEILDCQPSDIIEYIKTK